MMNGEGRVSSNGLKKSMFLHKGKQHYSCKGRYVECEVFYQMREMNVPEEKIFREFGKSFEGVADKEHLEWDKKNYQLKINNWQELLDFMFTQMKPDTATFIKKHIREDMKPKDLIPLLPEAFQPIFSLRLNYDERIKNHKNVNS